MQKPGPIYTMELFAPTREALVGLLEGLTPEEWHATTVVPGWNVKDIAGHLLKGELGILSRRRDGYSMPGVSIESWDDLVTLINSLNRTCVEAARMISPRVICDLLRWSAPQVEEYFASLDPHATGVPVDWVGPEPAPNWLDLAREYPEYRDSAAAVRLVDTTAADYYGDGYQDVQNRVPKIDNTRRDLDWAPQVPMDEALRRIFDAYRGHVADARALVE